MLTRNSCTLVIVLQLIAVFISRTEGSSKVDEFTKTFESIVKNDAKLQDVMHVADMDPDQAAENFYKVVEKVLKDLGNTRPSQLAQKLKDSVKKTFGSFDSSSYPTVLGNLFGNILESKGPLKDDNAKKFAHDYASAILLVLKTSNSSPPESYIQGIMEGSSNFLTSLGIPYFGNFNDVVKRYEEAVKSATESR